MDDIYVPGAGGTQVPLSSLVTTARTTAPLAVTHQGQFPAATLTFNLAPGMSLGEATAAVQQAAPDIGLPDAMRDRIRRQRPRLPVLRPATSRC